MANRHMFVKVYDDLEDHPRWQEVDRLPECVGLWTLALSYCHRNHTDGHFPARLATRRWGGSVGAVDELLDRGRWHESGHECGSCPQPAEGSLYLHDYLDHQRSREDIADLSAKRARAGSAGGRARAEQLAKQAGGKSKQTGGIAVPDTDTDTDTDTESKPRKRAHTLPSGFTPNDTNRRIAAECGVNLATAVASFKDYHGAKGTTMKDWHLALNTWIRRERPTLPRAVPASPSELPPPPSGDLFGNFGGAR